MIVSFPQINYNVPLTFADRLKSGQAKKRADICRRAKGTFQLLRYLDNVQ
jgi:hypothetical protein